VFCAKLEFITGILLIFKLQDKSLKIPTRIIERFGLEWTFKVQLVHPPCN